MRRVYVLAAIAGAAVVLAATANASAAVPRQYGSFTLTATAPGTVTGMTVDFHFQNPAGANLKPPAVTRMVIRSVGGHAIDTTVKPQCTTPDAVLTVTGPSGCPAAAQVGTGYAVTVSGSGPSRATITDFNAPGEITGVGVSDELPVVKTVDHTVFSGNTSTTDFPLITHFPPNDPVLSLQALHEYFPPYVNSSGRAYATTPSKCPASGYWTSIAMFTYYDGVTQSLASHSPCNRP